MSEDALVRATNLTRFTLACHEVGLPSAEVFGISDLQEASETSLSKVAKTIIALARLAGKANAGVGGPKSAALPSPTPCTPMSPQGAGKLSPTCPTSSRKPGASAEPILRTSMETVRPASATSGAISGSNDLQSRLQTMTSVRSAETEMEDSPKTSVAAVFAAPAVAKSSESPSGLERPHIPRSQTQPVQASIHLKSPIPHASNSRCPTPTGRLTPTAGRPILRPRYSSGARPQVTAVNGLPTLTSSSRERSGAATNTRAGLHIQDRTPSLISSRSRVTSGYSRSSGVQSIVSFPSGDYSHAAPWSLDQGDVVPRTNSQDYFYLSRGTSWQAALDGRAFIDSKGTPKDARGFALRQSLAALEGKVILPTDTPPTPTGRARPSSRLSRVEVSRVLEEDESAISPVSATPRPPIRRVSTNGKTYVPKRSASPLPKDVAVPSASTSQQDTARMSPPRAPLHSLEHRPPTLMARRQSETAVVNQSRLRSDPRTDGPMNMKISSMINLSGIPATFERNNSSFSTKRSSQVLEVCPPGRSPLKYVSSEQQSKLTA